MRTEYHEKLAQFQQRLGELARLAETAIGQATQALLNGDRELARTVTGGESAIMRLHRLLDTDAVNLLALQQPVASELRTVVAGLRMSADLERMGALARHVAEIVQQHETGPVVPDGVRPTLAAMGEVAGRMAADARKAMAARDATALRRLDRDDDEMDRLEAVVRQDVLAEVPPANLRTAMDLALLARFYERFGDHAVSLAKRVAYLAEHPAQDLTV
ncbi:phosphate signaling complex protein PhoU [Amycolatopsis alkalitolerans]|uniref:Phosphate-specific transport system accessory protein PhoU n=1 Tax=Amycolatopsis alkalitolerans TaxID=2547244 RepID=A0A5C4LRF9_9PSEU|nr:phosphate signaling complex protein PhoU [Amycolatopsis alkalitolerans]TNC21308.1 phosphate signaling complex protein PhoU [Amycolatopsis alkalitolerans]